MIELDGKYKCMVMAFLLGICCVITYYVHTVLSICVVFTHFFYIPIILAAMWWKRKGLVVAIFLAALLILSHRAFPNEYVAPADFIRAIMFVIVAFVVAMLSEQIAKVEETLRKKKEKYRTVVDNINDVVVALDTEGKFTYLSPRFEEATGYLPEDVIGHPFTEVLAPEYRESTVERFRRGLSGETTALYEVVILQKTGKRLPIELSVTTILDSDGQPRGRLAVARDISERKKTEEKLRLFSHSVDSSIDGMAMGDLEGRITYVNETFTKMFGYSREELIGAEIASIYPEDQIPKLKDALRVTVEEGWTGELIAKRKNGALFPIVVSSSRVKDDEGHVIAHMANHRDITEQKQREEERERLLKELEVKNTALDSFAYTVSHDLKAPLVSIRGFAGLLRDDLKQKEADGVERDLKYIETTVTKMNHLVNDTLELSRIGRVANPAEDVLFFELVQEAQEQTREQINSCGVELSMADDFPAVHVDRMRIVEVLVNLITNSINYRGEQSQPEIEFGYRIEGDATVFFVADNGIGIDKNQHEKVFDLFYKVDTDSMSTGAGLAIVKRIIDVHGGSIWIESEKGKGCTVCFTLPLSQG
ncbi:MAG: Methanogenesis regulatory histidine kinase FilI [Candidatus Methanophagaceae archaeon]|nr:MAG: Methanogenesis regulatory histidine kinase FilI [Methanophagales archaeon]KAF5435771.1 Signal transduction histidine kinase [Methanophagales archaeon]